MFGVVGLLGWFWLWFGTFVTSWGYECLRDDWGWGPDAVGVPVIVDVADEVGPSPTRIDGFGLEDFVVDISALDEELSPISWPLSCICECACGCMRWEGRRRCRCRCRCSGSLFVT